MRQKQQRYSLSVVTMSASDYDVTDTAALISAGDGVLNVDGVDAVVTGGPVDADTGEALNNMSADIEFDVSDTSAEIVENTASLGEANSVVVTGSAKADALNEADYQTLLTEMTGDGANITGHIDRVSVKPSISSFVVDSGDSASDSLTNVNEVTLTVMAEKTAVLKVFIDSTQKSRSLAKRQLVMQAPL